MTHAYLLEDLADRISFMMVHCKLAESTWKITIAAAMLLSAQDDTVTHVGTEEIRRMNTA